MAGLAEILVRVAALVGSVLATIGMIQAGYV
jgi:hypothetical protein